MGHSPEVDQKKKDGEKRKKEERLNDGNNNGQATHGARKHAWRTQAAWAKKPNALLTELPGQPLYLYQYHTVVEPIKFRNENLTAVIYTNPVLLFYSL